MDKQTPLYISTTEVARRWGTSREFVIRQVRSGALGAIHAGRVYRVPLTAVAAWEASRSTTPRDAA